MYIDINTTVFNYKKPTNIYDKFSTAKESLDLQVKLKGS